MEKLNFNLHISLDLRFYVIGIRFVHDRISMNLFNTYLEMKGSEIDLYIYQDCIVCRVI